jgi:hypothetical protein
MKNGIHNLFNFMSNYCGKDGWYVTGRTLQSFVKTGSIVSSGSAIEVIVEKGADRIRNQFGEKSVKVTTDFKIWKPVIKEFVPECKMIKCNFPANLGAVLDDWNPLWADMLSTRVTDERTAFFTKARCKEAHEQIAIMLDCAERVGIRDKMFLGFGGVLGYAWASEFMPKDDDIDICFLPIDEEKKTAYLEECRRNKLCETRMAGPEYLGKNMVWFSIGRKCPYTRNGVKACHWFWFPHGGFWWHSKGNNWTGSKERHKNYHTSKGIPEATFTAPGELREINFGGNKINIPVNIGRCLDWWYPEWLFRKQCSSAPSAILVSPNPDSQKTWFIERN